MFISRAQLAAILERAAEAVAGDNEPLYAALLWAATDCRHIASRSGGAI